MKNLWTTIHVKDLDVSVAFYTEILNQPVARRYKGSPGVELAFLGSGETTFELVCNQNAGPIEYTNSVSTGFEVESADDFMAFLTEKGIEIVEGPFEPGPHVKFFYILDPDGYRIQLVERREV